MSFRPAWLPVAVLVGTGALGACRAAPGVETESARARAEPTVSTVPTTPPATPPATAPATAPATVPGTAPGTEPAGSAPPPADEDLASYGDSLFEDIGNRDLDVQHYGVAIDYDAPSQVLTGAVEITAVADVSLDAIVLDAAGLDVHDVDVDGRPADFELREDELVVTPDEALGAGDTFVVRVSYEDRPDTEIGGGFDVGWFATETGSYVLNEPDALRTWLPSNDHPADKATWTFEITVADGLAAAANGRLVDQRSEGGRTTFVWEQDEPMSTYLVQLLTGEYRLMDGGEAAGVPLTHVVVREAADRMQAYFDVTAEQIEFFEQWFGPYPLDGYGLAITESYPGLAMETQGRSMFSVDDLPGGPLDPIAELLLSHELAHQWFGNAVSPADWADLWLNESFATYGQWMWFEHAGLDTVQATAEFHLAQRQLPGEATGSPSVENLFGYERYDGGAVVLHALRLELGDTAFFELLQRWVAANDGTSRTSADFITLAESVAGRSLTTFFDDWLYAATLPGAFPT